MSNFSKVKRYLDGTNALGVYVLIAAIAFLICLPNSPSLLEMPQRDSGVFLYVGQQISQGKVPYRDVWDHKGPLIYYINAIGLAITGGSRWGVWFIEYLNIFFSAVIGQITLQRSFGKTASIFATVAWLLALSRTLNGGNFTEEYALLLQFSAIYFFTRRDDSHFYSFLIGVTAALSFLLRANIVGIWFSIVLLVAILGLQNQSWRSSVHSLLLMLAGFATIIGITTFYFWNNDALVQFLDAAYRYNFYYSSSFTLSDRSNSFYQGIKILNGTAIVTTIAWLMALFSLFTDQRDRLLKPDLNALALIAFPVEILLIMVSGRSYAHYFMSMLPVAAVLLAFMADEIIRLKGGKEIRIAGNYLSQTNLLLAGLIVAMTILPLKNYVALSRHVVEQSRKPNEILSQVTHYIAGNDRTLLMWGAESHVNFLVDRESPTRFVYLFPLQMPGYASKELIDELILDIQTNRPIIIDTTGTKSPFPPIDPARRTEWYDWLEAGGYTFQGEELKRALAYIESHYEQVGTIGQEEWFVYQFRN